MRARAAAQAIAKRGVDDVLLEGVTLQPPELLELVLPDETSASGRVSPLDEPVAPEEEPDDELVAAPDE
jgi:hypothetical protein